MAGAVDEFVSLGHRLQGVVLYGKGGGRIGRVAFDGLPFVREKAGETVSELAVGYRGAHGSQGPAGG